MKVRKPLPDWRRHGGCEARAVAFPAKVNQLVGLIEYAIVTETGSTKVFYPPVASDIQAGLLLLGVKMPAKVYVEVSWQVDGK